MTAIDALSQSEITSALASLSDELGCILEDRDVPGWMQARIAYVGCTKVGTFGRIEPTEEAVRKWVTDVLLVDPMADPRNRTAIAAVLDAWIATRKRLDRKDDVEAEERAAKLPRTMPKKDYVRIKVA